MGMLKSSQIMYDRVFHQMVSQYGFYSALRFIRNLGIDFEDAYYMVFGKLPNR